MSAHKLQHLTQLVVEDAVVILDLGVDAGTSTTGAHDEFVRLSGFRGPVAQRVATKRTHRARPDLSASRTCTNNQSRRFVAIASFPYGNGSVSCLETAQIEGDDGHTSSLKSVDLRARTRGTAKLFGCGRYLDRNYLRSASSPVRAKLPKRAPQQKAANRAAPEQCSWVSHSEERVRILLQCLPQRRPRQYPSRIERRQGRCAVVDNQRDFCAA